MHRAATDLRRLSSRAELRARRLQLLSATWTAGGVDDVTALLTVWSELAGLSREIGAAGLGNVAEAVQLAADGVAGFSDRGANHATVGRRILILDDSEVTRDVIAVGLEGIGCIVTVASSLDECWLCRLEIDPEVILIEPANPGIEAEHICQRLRRQMKRGVVPIVLFSSEDASTLSRLSVEMQADGWVTKDQGMAELVHQIDEITGNVLW